MKGKDTTITFTPAEMAVLLAVMANCSFSGPPGSPGDTLKTAAEKLGRTTGRRYWDYGIVETEHTLYLSRTWPESVQQRLFPKVTLELDWEDARVLRNVSGRVNGPSEGPRGVFDRIGMALEDAGVPLNLGGWPGYLFTLPPDEEV